MKEKVAVGKKHTKNSGHQRNIKETINTSIHSLSLRIRPRLSLFLKKLRVKTIAGNLLGAPEETTARVRVSQVFVSWIWGCFFGGGGRGEGKEEERKVYFKLYVET